MDRRRRNEYDAPQRRMLFSRDEDDYEGDFMGSTSFDSSDDEAKGEASWRTLELLPPLQIGKKKQDIVQSPKKSPGLSKAEEELDQITVALKEGWRKSKEVKRIQAQRPSPRTPANVRPGECSMRTDTSGNYGDGENSRTFEDSIILAMKKDAEKPKAVRPIRLDAPLRLDGNQVPKEKEKDEDDLSLQIFDKAMRSAFQSKKVELLAQPTHSTDHTSPKSLSQRARRKYPPSTDKYH